MRFWRIKKLAFDFSTLAVKVRSPKGLPLNAPCFTVGEHETETRVEFRCVVILHISHSRDILSGVKSLTNN